MIQESTIERILGKLESGRDDYEREIQDFAEAQPHLMAFVTNDDNDVFTERELEQLLFGTLVIYQSILEGGMKPPAATPEAIEAAEEANYQVTDAIKGNLRAKLDPFFAATREEDLLAFAEDIITEADEEEDGITKEAREPLFLTLKTVIDVLT